jgi:hypothetical protein
VLAVLDIVVAAGEVELVIGVVVLLGIDVVV